jgi:hypothetical protein
MHSLDGEIRTRLGRYVRRDDTLEEFRDWFTPATWDLDRSDPGAQLARQVDFLIGEFVTGHIAERRLRARLSPLIETYVVVYGQNDLMTDLRTALSDPITTPPFSGAGTRP